MQIWCAATGSVRIVRGVALTTLLSVGALIHLLVLDGYAPLTNWIVWLTLRAALLAGLWAITCASVGIALVRRAAPGRLWLSEQLALGFGLGTFVFGWCIFLVGLAGQLGLGAFYGVAALLMGIGGKQTLRWAGAVRRVIQRPGAKRLRPAQAAGLCAGTVGLLLMYVQVLVPENVAYDARWYHLPLAEHYVAAGRIARFEEGWFLGAYPQLMSYHYTWAFSAGGGLVDKVSLCAHIEWFVFCGTLFAVVPLVRRLVGARSPLSWLGFFLFPGMFLYDSGLHVAADRLAGLYAPLIGLVLYKAWPRLEGLWLAGLAVLLAAAVSTKYTALSLVLGPILLVFLRGMWLGIGRKVGWRPLATSVGLASLMGLCTSSLHWLKNWAWYGDPVYPLSYRILNPRPLDPASIIAFENWFYDSGFRPPRNWSGIVETLQTGATFAFRHNDWPDMHGDLPVFGPLFTITTVCLPFVDRWRRLLPLVVCSYAGLFTWYWLHAFDRYLQILLPWFVACTMVVFIRAARAGLAPKLSVALLVAVQLVWSLNLPFFPGHSMLKTSVYEAAILLAQRSFAGQLSIQGQLEVPEEDSAFAPYSKIAVSTPKDAVLLVHEQHLQLGLGRRRVSDWIGTQGAINYARWDTPQRIREELAKLGVTHVVATGSTNAGYQSLSMDLAFYRFLRLSTRKIARSGALTLHEILSKEKEPHSSGLHETVAVFGCQEGQLSGVFPLEDFDHLPMDPRPWVTHRKGDLPHDKTLPQELAFAITYEGCPRPRRRDFSLLVHRPGETLWIRKRPRD